jgi:alkaline phosphatase D
VPTNAKVRSRKGVYQSKILKNEKGTIKLILLDTRYFRTPLKESDQKDMRYKPWAEADGGTILGETQWEWFQTELEDDTADFTVIITSIQFLSYQHGWEKWANHPLEVKKMYAVLGAAKAKNIILLSGDRHLAEIAVNRKAGLDYPLIEFTASGLTHTWIDSATEANEYRVSNVIKRLNFGVLHFNFEDQTVLFQIRGAQDFLYEEFVQQY